MSHSLEQVAYKGQVFPGYWQLGLGLEGATVGVGGAGTLSRL